MGTEAYILANPTPPNYIRFFLSKSEYISFDCINIFFFCRKPNQNIQVEPNDS
jgi:hypothetical protein